MKHSKVDWFFVALSLEMKYFSRLVVVLSWRSPPHQVSSRVGFHGLSFRIREWCLTMTKTIWSIQTKLIFYIEDFKVFAGNLTLVLCERNQSLSRKTFHFVVIDLELGLPAWILIPNNGKLLSLKGTIKKSVQPGTNWLSQRCDCTVFLPLTFLASAFCRLHVFKCDWNFSLITPR